MKRKTTRRGGRKLKPSRSTKPAVHRRTAKGRQDKTPPSDPISSLVVAQAASLGVPLEPSWQPGVTFNLQLILRLGAMVDEFALPDDAEPGPVFHA